MNIMDLSDICSIYFEGIVNDVYEISEKME